MTGGGFISLGRAYDMCMQAEAFKQDGTLQTSLQTLWVADRYSANSWLEMTSSEDDGFVKPDLPNHNLYKCD